MALARVQHERGRVLAESKGAFSLWLEGHGGLNDAEPMKVQLRTQSVL
jgi:hypothetical protein